MPGLRAALPAALLLLSSFPPAAARKDPGMNIPGELFELSSHDYRGNRAANVAIQYHNHLEGSPSLVLALREIKKAIVKVISEYTTKFYLVFSTLFYLTGKNAGICLATVLYQKNSSPQISIKCVDIPDKKKYQEEDRMFYHYLQHKKTPTIVHNIPDETGHIDPDVHKFWGLSVAASGYVMWKNSREDLAYNMVQIKLLKQWKTKDGVHVELVILFHEIPTENIVKCHMQFIWKLGDTLTPKYSCTPYYHWLEDGSGQDSKSAAGMSHEKARHSQE
ncbi:ovocalyxin-32-like [Excalfactoria chinensis]|uniref:ovocalyxin-32-like n=1 Tax=Excalfactoria chinensis TaxID=46218 RepID=UPI003B3A6FC8